MRWINFILLVGLIIMTNSCMVVKPYNKVALNDEDMELKAVDCERFETNFQIYREATTGANGGKTGGGCGCN